MGSHQPVPYSDGNDFHIGTDPVLHRDADDAREKAESIFDFDAAPDSVEPDRIPIYFVIDEMNFKKRRTAFSGPPLFILQF